MSKIDWCVKKKEGLSVIEPNSNLANAYMEKAEKSLESIKVNIVKEWKIATAYYTIYFSLYSILMKLGIKCEIHSCTIEFAKKFLKDYFEEYELEFVEDSLKARIDSQYYVNKDVPDKQYNKILEKAPEFFVKCKQVLRKLNENKINEIRKKFEDRL